MTVGSRKSAPLLFLQCFGFLKVGETEAVPQGDDVSCVACPSKLCCFPDAVGWSQNHRGWKGPLWVILSNPPGEAGSPTVGCTGPCPGGSGISPEKETPQPPWAACVRAPSPSEWRSSSSCSDRNWSELRYCHGARGAWPPVLTLLNPPSMPLQSLLGPVTSCAAVGCLVARSWCLTNTSAPLCCVDRCLERRWQLQEWVGRRLLCGRTRQKKISPVSRDAQKI